MYPADADAPDEPGHRRNADHPRALRGHFGIEMPSVCGACTSAADGAVQDRLAPRRRTGPRPRPADRRRQSPGDPARGPRSGPRRRPGGRRHRAGRGDRRADRPDRRRTRRARRPRQGRPRQPGPATPRPFDPAAPGCPRPAPAPRRPAHRRADLHRGGRDGVAAVDVPHPDLRHLRPRAQGRDPGRSCVVRLPACRAGRDPLPEADRPVLAEPAPRGRLGRAVLRRVGTTEAPCAASARGDPRHRAPGDAAPGRGSDLPPGLVAVGRPAGLRRPPATRLERHRRRLRRPRHRHAAAVLG
ncbi:hypothetical protein FF86_102213 [Frankia sp. CpI1-P]|nr:hypothetical protein FF86_102213 [Frankia sp. CpI1-P]